MSEEEFIAKLKAEIALPKYKNRVFTFDVAVSRSIMRHCSIGEELKLFNATKNGEIYLYLKGLNEFDSYIGTLPGRYYPATLQYITDYSSTGNNSAGLLPFDNHSAIIKDKSETSLTIQITLYNLELRKVISEMVAEYQKPIIQEKVRNTLNVKYTMRKPVRIRFYIRSNLIHKLNGDLSLKIFDKDHYIENCGNYEIQLLNDKLEVIAKAERSGQEALLLRVIKAYYNGNKLSIKSIENTYHDTSHLDYEKTEKPIDLKEKYGNFFGGIMENFVNSFKQYTTGDKHSECPIYLTIDVK